jgi:hypothetical protein
MPYPDVIRLLRDTTSWPVSAYEVSPMLVLLHRKQGLSVVPVLSADRVAGNGNEVSFAQFREGLFPMVF